MRRDYRLYELSEGEFEELVVKICINWLGEGVTPFAPGRDGGRDGKFNGKAECFPSANMPLEGQVVLQAKHVAVFDKSCSDKDFERLLKKEHAKIKRLAKKGLCDHYLVFTNRRYTGGADEKLIASLMALGVKRAHIIGVERLNAALDDMQHIREWLPNRKDPIPFRFEPDDLIEVIGAVHDYADGSALSAVNSARDFEKLKLREEKNKINGLSDEYYNQIIVSNSFPHFARIDHFLKNPRNTQVAALYHDSADELKQKILAARAEFATFDNVFAFLIEEIQKRRAALKGRRRMISVMLHYMYANCDIGSKKLPSTTQTGKTSSQGEGTSYKKLVCALFDLALLKVYEDVGFFHFVYHDGIFEALDDRKKLALLEVVREQTSTKKMQYIMTLIASDLPRIEEKSPPTFAPDEIILRLHDDGADGRLFKMAEF